ncbi:MAG: hypothetical protein RR986_00685 [Longicatena sp.]
MKKITMFGFAILGISTSILLASFVSFFYTQQVLTSEQMYQNMQADFESIQEQTNIKQNIFKDVISETDFEKQTSSAVIQKNAEIKIRSNIKNSSELYLSDSEAKNLAIQVKNLYEEQQVDASNNTLLDNVRILCIGGMSISIIFLLLQYRRTK